MKLNTLTKASQLLADIQQLDEQIISFDKIAMSVSDKKQIATIALGFPKEKKAQVDTDGYDGYKSVFSLMTPYRMFGSEEQSEDLHKFEIDEVETMVVCGALIEVKKERRRALVTQLLELGYTF